MTEALVTPQLLQWARERRGLPLVVAAEKLTIKPDKLEEWEQGNGRPTFRQAKSLAKKFYIPFGYLFLSSPPEERLPLPDFRTVAGAKEYPPSPDFLDVLNDVLRKQQWYREYQEGLGAKELQFIGRFTAEDNHQLIATDIRNTLGINENMREESHSWEQFLKEFINRAESNGILVLRSGIVGNNTHRALNVEEFRGFEISDNLAPVIFINGKDAKAAQIFTLAHELAHLWIGKSGISNPNYFNKLSHQQNSIEIVCNKVAAETVLPKEEFLSYWEDRNELKDNLELLAKKYRISAFVVLRRAYDNNKLNETDYYEFYQRLIAEHKRSKGTTGGDFYRSLLARNSSTLTTTLLVAAAEGRVSQKDAARLLNVKAKSLPVIQREILFMGSANA